MANLKTFICVEDGIVTGKVVDFKAPGPKWIEGDVPRVTGIGGERLYRIVNGAPVAIDQDKVDSAALAPLRLKRNRLLSDSDWTQMTDSPLSNNVKLEWKTYRQALRDLPGKVEDYDDVVFPDPPSS